VEDLRLAFGDRVRKLRTALKLSQEQLAERADLHWTFVSGVERGKRSPGLNTIARLARALEVTPSELLAGLTRPARRKN
jgi:transcriptional regulator with XRE-family HTH domain